MAMTATQKQDAYKFFIVSFGAITGVEYMNQINDAYNAGLTTKEIVNIYSTKPQFEAIYPRFLSNEQFADKLIENVVGASATAAAKTQAKADVVAAINAGWSKGDVVFQIFTNLSNKPADDADWAKTAAMLNNKVKVAEYYTETLLVNKLDLGDLGLPLQSVTADAASVEAAKKGNGSLSNGQTFTLTDKIGESVVGTAGNDTFSGVLDVQTVANGTVNVGDTIDGDTGSDTLNLLIADSGTPGGGTLPSGFSVKNVETINITYSDGDDLGALRSSTFAGATAIWQIDNDQTNVDFQNITVGAGVTAGFRSSGAAATDAAVGQTVTVADKVTSVTVALDKVADTSAVTFAETTAGDLADVTVTGSVTTSAGSNTLILNGVGTETTLNLGLTSGTTVTLATFGGLTAVDTSASTGKIVVDLSGLTELATLTGGAAAETFTIDTADHALTADLGAGNDRIIINGGNATKSTATAITLGAGKDTVEVTAAGNIFNVTSDANVIKGLTTIADFKLSEDVLDLKTSGPAGFARLSQAQLDSVADTTTNDTLVKAFAAAVTLEQYTAFNWEGDTYVALDNDASGTLNLNDGLIKLAGVADANEFTAANLVVA